MMAPAKTLSLLMVLAVLALGNTVVTVHKSGEVNSPVIRLKDVATVTGEHAAELDTLVVGRAAQPGYSRLLLRDELLLFTTLPEEVRKAVTLQGEERCSVKSAGHELFQTEIESKVRELILANVSWNRDDCSVTFKEKHGAVATLWSKEYEVELGKLRKQDLKGNVMIPVYLITGETKERISVQVELAVQTKVMVATRKLVPGEKLGKNDVTWKRMDITHLPYTPVTELSAGGEYTVRSGVVQAGAVVTTNRLKKSKMVERGMPITIIAESGAVSVSIRGRAREAGDAGEIIAVENSNSRKILRGIVIKPGVVRVHTGGNV